MEFGLCRANGYEIYPATRHACACTIHRVTDKYFSGGVKKLLGKPNTTEQRWVKKVHDPSLS